jgi:hypothetical protein
MVNNSNPSFPELNAVSMEPISFPVIDVYHANSSNTWPAPLAESIVSDERIPVESNEEASTLGFIARTKELWGSVKEDYKDASPRQKGLLLSALAFQVWNQGRFQQAVTIPVAIDVYMNTGGNELKAAAFFTAANYVQGFGIAATGGVAMQNFDTALDTFRRNSPKAVGYAKELSKNDNMSYSKSLITESTTGQATGPLFPFVAGEILSKPEMTTKDTLVASERVSRRIAVLSGIIGAGVLKLSETYPTNPIVEETVEWAQRPITWFAVGAAMYAPTVVGAGIKAIRRTAGNQRSQSA